MPSDDNKNHRLKRKRQKTRSRSIESHGKYRSKDQKSKSNYHHSSSGKRRSPSTSRLKSPRKRDDRKRRSVDRRYDYGDARSSKNHDFRKDHHTHNTFKDRRRSISRHNERRRRSHSSDHYDRFKELAIRGDKIIKNEKAVSPKPFMVPSVNHKPNLTSFASGSFMHNDRNSFSSQFPFQCTAPGEIQKDQRKRKSRWTEGDTGRIYIPGLPTTLPPNLSPEQEKAYILQLQIEEISRRLRLPNLGIPENHLLRSPSPEPVYDQYGKRTNTREARTRKKMEDDRHLLILEMYKINPEYKPPMDYKPQQIRFTDKVDIPQDDFPEINFVGLLIGPRGNSLKNLEKETGAKIIIRGKGSVKDGKLARKEAGPLPGEDEPLHAYITGTTLEVVERAKKRISEIIQNGIEVPESMNELRRQQLRELALLNGTLRENECLNKLKILTEAETIVTNTIICPICGGAGHIANDCMLRGSLTKEQLEKLEKEVVDTEYTALMKELGHNIAATQLKCLSNIVCTGALTSGISGLALPASETSEIKSNENGQANVSIVTSMSGVIDEFSEDDIPPLMPSGHLVVTSISQQSYNTVSSAVQSLTTKSEDAASSFFAETAQKWINDSVYTDPTMAIAAAALSQYAYHPLANVTTVPTMPTTSYCWSYPGYGGVPIPPCSTMPPSSLVTQMNQRWYSSPPMVAGTPVQQMQLQQPSTSQMHPAPPPPPPPPPPPAPEAI